jgi:hypothetical protein
MKTRYNKGYLFRWLLLGAICFPNVLFAAQVEESVCIKSISIMGNSKIPGHRIKSYLSFKEEDVLTIESLESAISISTYRLKASRFFILIDIYYMEIGNNEVEIIISLAENIILIDYNNTELGNETLFQNMFLYGFDFGFIADANIMAGKVGSSSVFNRGFLYLTFGGTSKNVIENTFAEPFNFRELFSTLDVGAFLNPEISVALSNSIVGIKELEMSDVSAHAQIVFDYTILESLFGVGFKDAFKGTIGYTNYDYWGFQNDINIFVSPLSWYELSLRNNYQYIQGVFPVYRYPQLDTNMGVRGLTKKNTSRHQSLLFSIENSFVNIITIPTKLTTIRITPAFFADAGVFFDTKEEIDNFNIGVGFSILLHFGSPINLPLKLDMAYDINNHNFNFYLYFGRYY